MKEKSMQATEWKNLFQPMMEFNEINRKAMQTLAELQSDYLNYLMEANVKLLKAMAESKDVKSAMEQQLEYIKEVDTKWCDVAEKEFAAARDAQQSINEMLEQSYLRGSSFFEQLGQHAVKH